MTNLLGEAPIRSRAEGSRWSEYDRHTNQPKMVQGVQGSRGYTAGRSMTNLLGEAPIHSGAESSRWSEYDRLTGGGSAAYGPTDETYSRTGSRRMGLTAPRGRQAYGPVRTT
jgi:hypothetical protein